MKRLLSLAALLAIVVVYSYLVLSSNEALAKNRMTVNVLSQQFAWHFAYPQYGGFKSDELRLEEGRQVELRLTALDVIHSFWVPEWRIKRDVVPAGPGGNDIDNTVVVTPNKIGTYNVVCTELCGYGHAAMRALVHVWPQQKFDRWLTNQARIQKKTGGPPFPTLNPGSNIPGESSAGGASSTQPTTTTSGSS